ncbi:MAG TPA: nitroreductase family protein [Acidimicrobiales bacterium]|nr:nitroreductase family protein [Acidimicrobiales bacterium]
MDLLDGIATTRAIRRYRPDPIPEDDLATILWLATRAPSGSNRQPTRFLVLRDGPGAVRAKVLLARAFRDGWGAKRDGHGFDTGSGADPASPKARAARAMQHYVDNFERTPVVVLACIRRWRQPHISEGGSVYPACQNLLLAARGLGYGGVLSMWHGFVDAELHAALGIPEDVVIAATVTLGLPEGRHGPVRRLPLRDVVYDDVWEGDAPWAVDPPDTQFTGAGPSREANPA